MSVKSPSLTIADKTSHYILHQSEMRATTSCDHTHAFSRAFTLHYYWLIWRSASILIAQIRTISHLVKSFDDALRLLSYTSLNPPPHHLINILLFVFFCDFDFFPAWNQFPLGHLRNSNRQRLKSIIGNSVRDVIYFSYCPNAVTW